jgi:hypothetical protein
MKDRNDVGALASAMRTTAAGLVQALTDAQRNGCLYRLEDPVHMPRLRPGMCLADLTVPARKSSCRATPSRATRSI